MIQGSTGEPFKYIEYFSATIQRVVYSGGLVPLRRGGREWVGTRWRRCQGNGAVASLIDRRSLAPSPAHSHLCIVLHLRTDLCFMMLATYLLYKLDVAYVYRIALCLVFIASMLVGFVF